MYPSIDVLGREFSSYSVTAVLGAIAVVIFTIIRLRNRKAEPVDVLYFLTYGFGFMVLGAMLLYQIVELDNLIKLLPYLFSDFRFFADNFKVGLVFYGGLYGALIGISVFTKVNNRDSRAFLMYLTPAIPLFHIFGRIGCFLSGCCYGIESDTFGIMAPDGNSYVPVQLIEAFGDIIIFIVLCLIKTENKRYYFPLGLYFVLYGIMRFVLEFFRGDEVRGFLGILSTSQWISIITVPLGLYCLLIPANKNFLNKLYEAEENEK